MSRLLPLLQALLPQRALSRLAGRVADSRWAARALIALFVRWHRVELHEAEQPDPARFGSFNDFFTRALRPGARPVAQGDGVAVCPADGALSALGTIEGDRLLQAKGRHYTVGELLAGDRQAMRFAGGAFAVVYLSPRDYHRVHMPMDGRLERMLHVPGRLFSVDRAAVRAVPRLFARNERVVCLFRTGAGAMAVVMVGAMLVAGIETAWAGRVRPDRRGAVRTVDYRNRPPVELAAGDELGRFRMGSTVIVLFGPGGVAVGPGLAAGDAVRVGQALGAAGGRP